MTYDNEEKFNELADKLEAKNDPTKYGRLIENLRNMQYHDFANTMFATPKMQMVADLRAVDMEEEAQRVINGEYDQ